MIHFMAVTFEFTICFTQMLHPIFTAYSCFCWIVINCSLLQLNLLTTKYTTKFIAFTHTVLINVVHMYLLCQADM